MPNKKQRILIVDGYNVLHAQYPGLTGHSIEEARDKLAAMLHDYAGYSDQKVIVVFDAWQSDRMRRSYDDKDERFSIVFTKHAETADHYIERLCGEYTAKAYLGKVELRVATSDFVEQTVVMGRGAVRMSSKELLNEIEHMKRKTVAVTESKKAVGKATVGEHLPKDVMEKLERMRRGE